jgi:hypothetical protein
MRAVANDIIDTDERDDLSREFIVRTIQKHCPFKVDTVYMPVRQVEPGNIRDWASAAAEYIDGEYSAGLSARYQPRISRIASIIATFAEPLVALLRESKHEGSHAPSCPSSRMILGDDPGDYECTCDARDWNTRVDRALAGDQPI